MSARVENLAEDFLKRTETAMITIAVFATAAVFSSLAANPELSLGFVSSFQSAPTRIMLIFQ